MPSSGSYDYSIDNGSAVLMAFDRIGILPAAVTTEHMWTARNEMNLMFVEWSNKQVNLWSVELITTPLLDGVPSYVVPPRVVMILDAYIVTNAGTSAATDRVVSPISRTDYASMANKLTPGPPTSFWFDRQIAPTISMWPVPDATGPFLLKYYACVQIQNANLGMGELPNIPYLWLDAFVAGLAFRLSRKYAPDKATLFKSEATETWTVAATQNVENVAMSIQPGLSAYRMRR